MGIPPEPFVEPATSKEKIFRATYLAQTEHGVEGLSIQRIADQADLSKSTIYHHFDDKDELMMEYGKRVLEWYIDQILFKPEESAIENLERSLDLVFLEETDDGINLDDIRPQGLDCVYLSLRMQASRDPEMREYFDAIDELARERLEALIDRGIEEGSLEETDSKQVAAVLYLFTEGGLLFRSTETDTEWLQLVRAMLDEYLADLKVDA